jgi:hypothetical protein
MNISLTGISDFIFRPTSNIHPTASMTKPLLYRTDGMFWEQAMRVGVDAKAIARATEDCKAGVAKFLRKKK